MATKLPSSLKRRASEEPTLLDLDVTSAKRIRLGPTEFSDKASAETIRSASLPGIEDARPKLCSSSQWFHQAALPPAQSPSSLSSAAPRSEHSAQTRHGWQAQASEPYNDVQEDVQSSLPQGNLNPEHMEGMDYEPYNTVSKSSSAPDLRLLLEGVKPAIPQPLLTSYDRPDMSSLATALIPYKAPLGGQLF